MKKLYIPPELEVVEFELEEAIAGPLVSGETGGVPQYGDDWGDNWDDDPGTGGGNSGTDGSDHGDWGGLS